MLSVKLDVVILTAVLALFSVDTASSMALWESRLMAVETNVHIIDTSGGVENGVLVFIRAK